VQATFATTWHRDSARRGVLEKGEQAAATILAAGNFFVLMSLYLLGRVASLCVMVRRPDKAAIAV